MIFELFWDFTRRRMVIYRRRFGKTYLPHLQESVLLDRLTLEDWAHRFSRNVGKKLPLYCA